MIKHSGNVLRVDLIWPRRKFPALTRSPTIARKHTHPHTKHSQTLLFYYSVVGGGNCSRVGC